MKQSLLLSLLILSKTDGQLPIRHNIFFPRACRGHTFVRSGFIYARILHGKSEIPIHTIATHLQPSDHRGCFLSSEERIREK
ncbi:unnamed protein product [Rotaria socialis]|uniref:Secreted protein n=1 Tax=Rotaria socialis TaxID=392032 RepID=A0A820LA89_9BILA|nr:unnamed protein product [Rotaria socialis]CAF4852624.1 unnamed protein product [Rotaria socialis]